MAFRFDSYGDIVLANSEPVAVQGREVSSGKIEDTIRSLPDVEMALGRLLRAEKELETPMPDEKYMKAIGKRCDDFDTVNAAISKERNVLNRDFDTLPEEQLAALPAEVIDAQKVRRVEVDAMWTAFADHLVNYVLPSRHITHKNEPLS